MSRRRVDDTGTAWEVRAVNSSPGISLNLSDRQLSEVDSPAAWRRLGFAVAVGTIGSVGMWLIPVALPFVQADFGIARAEASLPYTLAMTGYAFGGVAMGRLCDRFGIVVVIMLGTLAVGIGYVGASLVPGPLSFALMHIFLGVGASATFGPLMADMVQWFVRHRGIAVGMAASGNYIGGALWPPLLQHAIATEGWRHTYLGIGVLSVLATLPFIFALRGRAPVRSVALVAKGARADRAPNLGISPNALMVLLSIAGLACCVAMAMPQIHIVAYCGDLGYGPARGAEMLSTMLGFGILSRIASGLIADRLGGAATLLISSVLQAIALFLYLLFDGLVTLYVISALFGLFQGGIVPMYALIVRQYFPPKEVGIRIGIVLMATLFGMALGGWMSGVIFDHTGSYQLAFLNGLIWNMVNATIVLWLLLRPTRKLAAA
jgi:MFS family permease